MIRGIVFDLFDTLVDQNHDQLAPVEIDGRRMGATTPALHACAVGDFGVTLDVVEFAGRLQELDRELRVETIDRGLELPTVDRFAALGSRLGLPDESAFALALTRVHMGALRKAVSVPVHHEAVLVALASDYRIGICSNFTHAETARAVLRDAAFDAYLSTVVISEEVGFRKPRREIFDAVVESMGVGPREILHIGDNLEADVAGAAKAGLRTVWLTRQVADPGSRMARYEGPRPDFSLEDLLDLPVLIARMTA